MAFWLFMDPREEEEEESLSSVVICVRELIVGIWMNKMRVLERFYLWVENWRWRIMVFPSNRWQQILVFCLGGWVVLAEEGVKMNEN